MKGHGGSEQYQHTARGHGTSWSRYSVFWVNDAAVPDAQVALCVFEAGDFARHAARAFRP